MRVLFIVDDHVSRDSDGEVTADLASTRIRLILAMKALNRFGQDAKIVANTTPRSVLESPHFQNAETIVFGKVFQDYGEVARRARALGKVLFVDITDDPMQTLRFTHIQQVAGLADCAIVPTAQMGEVARRWLPEAAVVVRIEDAFEAKFAPPFAQFRRAPERLELVWYGSPTNAAFLKPHLNSLETLAYSVPLRLTMVSKAKKIFEDMLSTYSERTFGPLVANFVEWTPIAQQEAIAAADIVLLPGEASGLSAPKSANRLISAIAGGRLAIASPLPAYQALSDHALVVENLVQGLSAALVLPAIQIERRLAAGQEAIKRRFSPDLIGRKWVQSLAGLTRQIRLARAKA